LGRVRVTVWRIPLVRHGQHLRNRPARRGGPPTGRGVFRTLVQGWLGAVTLSVELAQAVGIKLLSHGGERSSQIG
jgi:hypothetical protein